MTNDELINKFSYFIQTISKKFSYETELDNFNETGKKPFSTDTYVTVNYKGYPRFTRIKLPKPLKLHNFHAAMMGRKSSRQFTDKAINLKELSTLLYYSAGLRRNNGEDMGNRFYPSAGGRYPLEAYPIIFNCKGLSPGIYHYHIRSHSLEFLWNYKDLKDKVFNFIKQQELKKCSSVFAFSAVTNRTESKYGPRGFRHILMEVGHICQNLHLVSASLKLGSCSIGGFIDKGFNSLLDLDGYLEKTLMVIPIGKLKGGDNND